LNRVLACNPVRPEPEVIDEAAAALKSGGVVVMPTETQYSLSIRGDLREGPKIICDIKKRAETVRAALFIKNLDMAREFCEVSEAAEKLARRFLPGPLTLVLPERKGQKFVSPGFLSEDGFGIRISSSPVIAAVMDKVPFAVTATSANLSGQVAPKRVREIREMLQDKVDLYLDAGPCSGVVPSTVAKISDRITILREGIVSGEEIKNYMEKEA
jgi:L-threonylcarbamoyladenylate synthase